MCPAGCDGSGFDPQKVSQGTKGGTLQETLGVIYGVFRVLPRLLRTMQEVYRGF